MNKIMLFAMMMSVFLAGWFFNTAYASLQASGNAQFPFSFNDSVVPKAGPKDHIGEDHIRVYKKAAVLDIENLTWARFTDTHSMEPTLNKDSNGLEVKPQSEKDIAVGDIISYYSDYADGLIIHRVISQGYDKNGWYVIVKGDNLNEPDPGKIRFSQIHGVLVGIIY